MRKLNFFKTLLVAVGLLVGGNVWATDVPYNVGTSTSDAWGTGFSDVWTMTGDGAVTVTFTNHCATDGNWWDNWQLLCGNDSYEPGSLDNANRYFQMRSDRWDDAAGSAVGFIMSDDYFTDFKAFQNEATVTMKIVRSGTTVTVNTSVTKSAATRTMTFVKTGLSGTLNFFLTQSLSYMEITQQTQTTEMAGTISANALVNFEGNTGTGAKGSISVYNSNYNTDNAGVLYLRNGGGTLTIDASEFAGSKDIVTVSFDMMFVSMGKAKSAYFALQDKDEGEIGGITFDVYSNSFSNNTLGLVTGDLKAGSWAHFTITLNYNDNTITTATSCPEATNATNSHVVKMTNTNPLAKFYVGAGYNASVDYQKCRFDNLLIQTEKGDYNTTANITLAFKDDEDNDISALYKGATAFTPDKSTTFTPSDYYPVVMYDENYKYTYTSGGDAFTVTTDATVTLVYTKSARPTYTYNVTANYGAKSKKIVDAVSVKEAADYTYYYPRFILDGTTLYEYTSSTDANASASYWTSTHTNVAANRTYTLTYNAIDGECVYYSEGEDITGAINYNFADFRTAMSGGKTGVLTAASLTSLEAGNYAITARAVGRAGDRYVDVYKESVDDANKIYHLVAANAGSESTAQFTLDATTALVASAGYNTGTANGGGCDYIYIMKLPASESVTVTSAGYATYVSDYDLDYSSVSDLTAYKATVSGSTITFNKVTTVPAGESVLLKGVKGVEKSYSVPVTTGVAAWADDDNAFIRGTGAAVASEADGKYNYILNNVGGVVGFYKAAGQTVATNRAYIQTPVSTSRLSFVFDDEEEEVTGIKTINAVKNGEAIYNLNGQRVNKAKNGLYILNGRKVMFK